MDVDPLEILDALQKEGDEGLAFQLEYAGQLCEILAVSSDEDLQEFQPGEFIPVLSKILCQETHFIEELPLLVCRALTHFVDYDPKSSELVVKENVLPALYNMMGTPNEMSMQLPEQCLRLLDKLAVQRHVDVVESGGIAVLVGFVLNVAPFLPPDVTTSALVLMVHLCRQARTAEKVHVCITELDKLWTFTEHGERTGLIVLDLFCIILERCRGMEDERKKEALGSCHWVRRLVDSLSVAAFSSRASLVISKACEFSVASVSLFLEGGLAVSIRDVLDPSGRSASDDNGVEFERKHTMGNLPSGLSVVGDKRLHVLLDVVSAMVSAVLKPADEGASSDHGNPKNEHCALLLRSLVPALMCSHSHSVDRHTRTAISDLLVTIYSKIDVDLVQHCGQCSPVCRCLVGMMGGAGGMKDCTNALLITTDLLNKSFAEYRGPLLRHGVIHQVAKFAKEKDENEAGGSGDQESEAVRELAEDVMKIFSAKSGDVEPLPDSKVMDCLVPVCKILSRAINGDALDDDIRSALVSLRGLLSEKNGVFAFELDQSGILTTLLEFLCVHCCADAKAPISSIDDMTRPPRKSIGDISDVLHDVADVDFPTTLGNLSSSGDMSSRRTPSPSLFPRRSSSLLCTCSTEHCHRRNHLKIFRSVFLPSDYPSSNSVKAHPFRILVAHMQAVLEESEKFRVYTHDTPGAGHGLKILAKPLKITFRKAEDEKTLRRIFAKPVVVEPLTPIEKVADFLAPKVQMRWYNEDRSNIAFVKKAMSISSETSSNVGEVGGILDNLKKKLMRPIAGIDLQREKDFDKNGVLYWIATDARTREWVNPHVHGLVTVSHSDGAKLAAGTAGDLVSLSGDAICATKDTKGAWVSIDLGVFVVPTSYSIRHTNRDSGCLRNWEVQGSYDGTEWVTLRNHTDDKSLKGAGSTHSWTIEYIHAVPQRNSAGANVKYEQSSRRRSSTKPMSFRFIRLYQTGKNSNGDDSLVLGGLEIYGIITGASTELSDVRRSQAPNPALLYTCPYCRRAGFTERAMVEHVLVEHRYDSSRVKCPLCLDERRDTPSDAENMPNHAKRRSVTSTFDLHRHLSSEHGGGGRVAGGSVDRMTSSGTCDEMYNGEEEDNEHDAMDVDQPDGDSNGHEGESDDADQHETKAVAEEKSEEEIRGQVEEWKDAPVTLRRDFSALAPPRDPNSNNPAEGVTSIHDMSQAGQSSSMSRQRRTSQYLGAKLSLYLRVTNPDGQSSEYYMSPGTTIFSAIQKYAYASDVLLEEGHDSKKRRGSGARRLIEIWEPTYTVVYRRVGSPGSSDEVKGKWPVAFVERSCGTEKLPKGDVVEFLQCHASESWLKQWSLRGKLRTVIRSRNSKHIVAAYKDYCGVSIEPTEPCTEGEPAPDVKKKRSARLREDGSADMATVPEGIPATTNGPPSAKIIPLSIEAELDAGLDATANFPLSSAEPARVPLLMLRVLRMVGHFYKANLQVSVGGDNTEGAQAIDREMFISQQLSAKLHRQLLDPLSLCSGALPDWTHTLVEWCPFLFPFELRSLFFAYTAFGVSRAIHQIQENAVVPAGQGSSAGSQRNSNDQFRVGRLQRDRVRIRRHEDVVAKAIRVFDKFCRRKTILDVEFQGEPGTGSGVTLEYYNLVAREMTRRDLNMWYCDYADATSSANENAYIHRREGLFPAPLGPADASNKKEHEKILERFKFLGRMLGKALQDNRVVDLHLSPTFLKRMVGHPLSLSDILDVDLQLGRHLVRFQNACDAMRRARSKEERDKAALIDGCPVQDLGLAFTYRDYELRPGGAQETVTVDTLPEYVSLMMEHILIDGVARQMDAFFSGFGEVAAVHTLRSFSARELESLLLGEPARFTPESLLENIIAQHGYTVHDEMVRWLVEVLSSLSPADQGHFLRFSTGCPRLPPGGIAALSPKLTIVRKDASSGAQDEELPSVNTCFHFIKLPRYSSMDILRERLVSVIHAPCAFDLS